MTKTVQSQRRAVNEVNERPELGREDSGKGSIHTNTKNECNLPLCSALDVPALHNRPAQHHGANQTDPPPFSLAAAHDQVDGMTENYATGMY